MSFKAILHSIREFLFEFHSKSIIFVTMESILINCTKDQSDNVSEYSNLSFEPQGFYNNISQTWKINDETNFNYDNFKIYMGTGSPTTYSSTTSNIRGKLDTGRDDTGT